MNKLFKNTLVFTLSNFLIQGLQFFLLPFYSNLISTQEYGLIGTFNTSAYLIGIVASLNLSAAISKYYFECKTELEIQTFYSKIVKATALIASAICGAVLIIALIIFSILSWSGYIGFLMAIVSQYITFYYVLFQSLCVAKQKATLVAISTVAISLTNLLGTFICVMLFSSKLIGYYMGTMISSLVGFMFFWIGSRGYLKRCAIKDVKKYIKYSTVSIPSALAFWVVNTSDRYAMIGIRGASETGVYNMAANFSTIHNMITMSVNNVYVPNTFNNLTNTKDLSLQKKLMNAFLAINLWSASGLIALLSNVIGILNEAYRDCYWTAIILLISSFFVGIMQIYNGIVSFYLPIMQKKNLIIAGGALLNIILNFALIPNYGAVGAAIATVAANIFIMVGVMMLSVHKKRVYAAPIYELLLSIVYIILALLCGSFLVKLLLSFVYTVAIGLTVFRRMQTNTLYI